MAFLWWHFLNGILDEWLSYSGGCWLSYSGNCLNRCDCILQGIFTFKNENLFSEVFWYGCDQKVLVTLFPYIFLIKAKRNIVYKYLKTKNLLRDTNTIPQMHQTSNNFRYPATNLNFKKTVCQKKIWMRHC